MSEIWKPIKNYEGKYEVSNLGRVKSLQRWSGKKFYDREKILSLYTNKKNGYVYVMLAKENKEKNIRVHRLVAEAFIDNVNNLPIVNHKDGNRANNNVNNLEWCDYRYNAIDGFKRKGIYDNDKDIIEKYLKTKNTEEVANIYGCSKETIRQVLIRNNIKRFKNSGRKKKIKE